ncbi:hypothetical protein SynA1528_00548 [Synechococcus sp. A15-28]|nr:hypothetical protein SynA1528_00548 [Synechococcus sp. A15-28]
MHNTSAERGGSSTMEKEGNGSAGSTPPSWRRWPGLRH